jgi:DNA-binding response OmpR family regulator
MGAILVADYDELPRVLKAEHLADRGHDVETVGSHEALLARLCGERSRFDLVIVEDHMIRRILEWWLHDFSPRPALVVTSDTPSEIWDIWVIKLPRSVVGCDDFLVRPFSLDELTERVERVLTRRR